MVKLFATKTISGNPYDAMDTTFLAIFSYFAPDEVAYYVEAPAEFKGPSAIKTILLKSKIPLLRILEKVLVMRKLKPDWLFGHGGGGDLPFVIFKPRNTKYIINFHSMLFPKGTPEWPVRLPWTLRKYLFQKADVIVAISEASRETVVEYFPKKRVELVYSGVHLDQFVAEKRDREYLSRTFSIRFDKPLVVYVGSLQSRKRPDVFIEIAKKYPKANFLMVGKPDGIHDFIRASKGLANFTHIDQMSREDIVKLFASADAFLFPSLQEPYGLVVVEAMAAGLPVIVSASGAFPELVRNREDGVLIPVDEREVARFVAALDEVLFRSDLRKQLSENAVHNVKRFSWANTASGYRRILLG